MNIYETIVETITKIVLGLMYEDTFFGNVKAFFAYGTVRDKVEIAVIVAGVFLALIIAGLIVKMFRRWFRKHFAYVEIEG